MEREKSRGEKMVGVRSQEIQRLVGELDEAISAMEEMADLGEETFLMQWKKRAERAEALIAELLDNYDPYHSAFERAHPSGDGEELARRMREAIGRRDPGEPT